MNAPHDPGPDPEIAAAILAGGRARRMHGQDKSALPIGGRPIIDRQLDTLRRLTPHLLIVSDDPQRFARHDVPVVPDLVPNAGPLGGLYTALTHHATHNAAAYTLILACDMPFVSIDLLRHLVMRAHGWDAAAPRTADGYHPLCAVYARSIAPLVRQRLAEGQLAMTGLLRALRVAEIGPDEVARFDPDAIMLSNVNTPHDYRQACTRGHAIDDARHRTAAVRFSQTTAAGSGDPRSPHMSTPPRIAVARARAADDYLAAIRRAGGDPWLVGSGEQSPDDVLSQAAGVLLLGGNDVDPALYGEARHPATQDSEEGRDAFEIALIRRAVEKDVPLLAICRGLQVLNVALGGTLIQDIPSQQPDAMPHALDPQVKAAEPRDQWKARVAHAIDVVPGSRLAALLPEPHAREVNSRHHQAVKGVANDLLVCATASDGIIEALERPASTFLVAVQWHPENFVDTDERFGELFRGFVRAAADAAAARAR